MHLPAHRQQLREWIINERFVWKEEEKKIVISALVFFFFHAMR